MGRKGIAWGLIILLLGASRGGALAVAAPAGGEDSCGCAGALLAGWTGAAETPEGEESRWAAQLGALEWLVARRVSAGTPEERVARLEERIFGGPRTGPLSERMRALQEAIAPQGRLEFVSCEVPAGTAVAVRLLTELDSAAARPGEPVEFELVRSVRLGDLLVLPAGARGRGQVKAVAAPGALGRDGRVEVEFGLLPALDGTPVRLSAAAPAVRTNSVFFAAAAGLLGVVITGTPVGLAAALLVRGQETLIPVGAEVEVEVAAPARVLALPVGPEEGAGG
ncbi:MAG: hypothetical protein QJR13_06640 [Bacillota bacterium]|nr:hypothetical protein [Bacillota bacterium]